MGCNIIVNNELDINESASNLYYFMLRNVPTSFLLSKFANDPCFKLDGKLSSLGMSGIDYIRESNQATQNLLLYLQSFTLPNLELGTTKIETMFAALTAVTGKLQFGQTSTNLLIDENWFVYRLMLYWFYAASNPEEFNKLSLQDYYKNFYIEGYLVILNTHHEKVAEFQFKDLHPQAMGQVDLNYQNSQKIVVPITWIYSTFTPTDDIIIKRV